MIPSVCIAIIGVTVTVAITPSARFADPVRLFASPIKNGKTNDVKIVPATIPPESKAISENRLGEKNIKIMFIEIRGITI